MNQIKKETIQNKINQLPGLLRLFLRRGILSLAFIFWTFNLVSNTQSYQRILYYVSLICFIMHFIMIVFLYKNKLYIPVQEYDEMWMIYPKKITTEITLIAIIIIVLIVLNFIFSKILI